MPILSITPCALNYHPVKNGTLDSIVIDISHNLKMDKEAYVEMYFK